MGKVLLVCDDLRGFPPYRGILSALGYDVVMCSSYEEGARRVEMEEFDFAIVGQGSASLRDDTFWSELQRRIGLLPSSWWRAAWTSTAIWRRWT
jgi:hypothetical protein